MSDKSQSSGGPVIFAVVLLMLPVLYIGSYLSLVKPEGRRLYDRSGFIRVASYRVDGRLPSQFYWPLEKIDRRVRPQAWSRQKVFYMLCPTSPLP